ncbi:hypothetical protein [Hydrogenophaga sp.]|uniref:hypothetical protein n=1 Tax=Hydrogenophaga sp. TaxID=1904254 RepID=UPI00272168DE|nr:hypothetical protein [Hydrogenophaga sp.]MDO8903916.1 hypothetical protein [Hydrogenophaga sp.]
MALIMMAAFTIFSKPYIDQFDYKPANTLPANWPGMQPSPEIVAGSVFLQMITPVESELRPNELHFPVCVDLQFVNYANRKNRGSILVTLLTDKTLQSVSLQAQDVEDNKLRSICFDQVPFNTLQEQTVYLEIKGIDSAPGSAVSAVFSSKPGSPTVMVNGTATTQTLVLHLNIAKDAGWFKIFSYVFLLFSAVLIALFSLTLRFSEHAEQKNV